MKKEAFVRRADYDIALRSLELPPRPALVGIIEAESRPTAATPRTKECPCCMVPPTMP